MGTPVTLARPGHHFRVVAAVVLALLAPILQPALAGATGIPTGYDISFPQCDGPYPPAPYGVAVVGVNGGRPYRYNRCLDSEYLWASSAVGSAAVYINLEYGQSAAGPLTCESKDRLCRAYNYGHRSADSAYDYAQLHGAATASRWWLDVETANTWSVATSENAEVIKGAIDSLQARPLVAHLGAYSTGYQWNHIVGAFRPGIPSWVAGALSPITAALKCTPDNAFAGSTVELVQYPAGAYDGDYIC